MIRSLDSLQKPSPSLGALASQQSLHSIFLDEENEGQFKRMAISRTAKAEGTSRTNEAQLL